MKTILYTISLFLFFSVTLFCQPDLAKYPCYTTYAAAIGRSDYKLDQGYQFVWYDPEKSISLVSEQAGEMGIIFKSGSKVVSRLKQYYSAPSIVSNYSDLVSYYYSPFKDLDVDALILVYSSGMVVQEFTLTNKGRSKFSLSVYPFIQNKEGLRSAAINQDRISFQHTRVPDSWMKEHNIPIVQENYNLFYTDIDPDASALLKGIEPAGDSTLSYLLNAINESSITSSFDKVPGAASFQIDFVIPSGSTVNFRVVRAIADIKDAGKLYEDSKHLLSDDLTEYLAEDVQLYSAIPSLKFNDPGEEQVYRNAFSLMRQCMMPPEGMCTYNYYVFSREPKWGWGYGGQVFHESLIMLAYAFMDPVSAMNSQRVFMERQWENGYINYRTGPYLDEQIVTNGQYTSSAPWFNWQNYEVYKITKDKSFLSEAYESGKKFYNYYVSNRDSDNDGLCEWGAHAVLESVRDARVAVWDEVADPVNFEAADCNIMLVSEAKALAAMAEELGLAEESNQFQDDADKRTALINKFMWDEETGFYYHVDKKDHDFSFNKTNDLKRKEIIAFLALWAGVADKEQAKKLLKHLTNKEEFWRSYGVPTLSADDPYYNPIGYWNGPVWLPWQYLIFRGLLDYGYKEEAEQLYRKNLENVSYQLKTNHYFWEFYSADDLQAGWNKTYIWSGIIARMAIDLYKDK